MRESPTSIPKKSWAEPAARIGWGLLIVATLYVCYFSHLGAIGFVGPDEPRYAWIARDMAETSDWVTPRLYGKPWFEKPPLYYWGAALCFKVFGVSEAAARLPSAISALLATLALAWLARRLYGGETARWLLLLLPTTVGMIGFSHAAATDMPFSGMLTIAMVCAAVVLRLAPVDASGSSPAPTVTSTPWIALVLFGIFLGLAVLAKGPAAIMLCGGAVFFWALITRRWRDAFRLLHPAAIAAFCLTALPWYILCARRNADFFRIFIIEHNFKRFLTSEFQHIQPFWFYIPILILALLPGVGWLARYPIGWLRTKSSDIDSSVLNYFAAWAVFPVFFFTISQSKLPGYILPSILPFGFLVALSVKQSLKNSETLSRWLVVLIGVLYLLSAFWVVRDFFSDRSSKGPHWMLYAGPGFVLIYCLYAGLGGVAAVLAGLLNRARVGLLLASTFYLFVLATVYDSLIKLNLHLSPRTVVADIEKSDANHACAFDLQRSWLYGLNFYLHREVPEWNESVEGRSIVVTNESGLLELKRRAKILHVISNFSPQAQILEVRPLADGATRSGEPK